jgi:hypothetical protein
MFEDSGLDSLMESRINDGAGDIIDHAPDPFHDAEAYAGVEDSDACEECGCNPCECDDESPEPDDSMDGDHDSAMASAGFGTDEDYGGDSHDWEYYGSCED